ncbi:MAG: hypothetical protein J2P39_08980, partial [Candidatus Dormibacteraeota bacterium]|nr:hypothetical protein [Candidatus Dormibacteraeota bacterium]
PPPPPPAIAAGPTPTPGSGGAVPGVQSSAQTASFSIDTVPVTVSSRFLPAPQFAVSKQGDLSQTATASAPRPYAGLSVTTVPFGTKAGTEALPMAKQGAAADFRSQLRSDRQKQGAQITTGPSASLFGASVTSQVAVVRTGGMSAPGTPMVVVEWVSQAGNRIWLVRASAQTDAADQSAFVGALSDLRVDSSDVNRPTTISTAKPGNTPTAPTSPAPSPATSSPGQSGRGAGLSDLSATPSWWSGDCDSNHYAAGSGQSSFRLGATYLGMPACGPRPIAGGVDVAVNEFSGAWGEFEWECVELVMRYLYQGYGIAPYPANGNQVVSNYQGNSLRKIANATQGVAPQPGDILSYGPDTTFGHASVVAASNVDSSGNGSITVVEENNSAGGTSTLNVSGWDVQAFETVSGWLHPVVPMGMTPKPAGPETSWSPNRLDAVTVGSDGAVWHKDWSGGWSGWESLKAGPASQPIAVSWEPDRLDVFVRGWDNALWHTSWDGTRWAGYWDSLGGQFYGDPEVVSWGPGRLDVFVRGLNNGLWHRAWNGQQWGGWDTLGGSMASTPDVVAWGTNRLDIVAQGWDGSLWHADWNGSSWDGWGGLGGTTPNAPTVVAWGPNRLDVVVRGMDNQVWHTQWDGSRWGPGWGPLGGTIVSQPAAAAWGSNRLDIVAQAWDGSVWHTDWSGSSWEGWDGLGGTLRSAPRVVSWGPNRLDIFGQAWDNGLWHTAWNGASWQGFWDSLGHPPST